MRQTPRLRATKNRPVPCCFAAVAGILCLTFAAHAAAQSSKRTLAQAQFERAERLRTTLEAIPQQNRTVRDYTQLVTAYRRVYLITPRAAEVPAALMQVANLFRDMGQQFDPKYFQSAIDAYQFLLHEYPASRYRDAALLAIGQIQKDNLEQTNLAEKTFEQFLKAHPRSPKADAARQALAEISAARKLESLSSANQVATPAPESSNKLAEVTQVRTWNAPSYTRIVIDLQDQVRYEAARITNPDRIYFDIEKAKLSSAIARKPVEVQPGGFLKSVRIAQNRSDVVRVVLDVNHVKDYSVFLLPDPYRLVVDVYGPAAVADRSTGPAGAGKAAPPAAKATAPAPKIETGEARPSEEKPAERIAKGPEETSPGASAEPPRAGKQPAGPPGKKVREAAATIGPAVVPPPTHDGQRSLTRTLGLKIGRIVIDPGHGGHDTGTIGPTGLMEKDLCLDVALRLGKLIQQRLPGAEVIYTRDDDTYVPLEDRTAIANQAKADLFLSIHANSSHDRKIRGVETYYLNFSGSPDAMEVAARENAVSQNTVHDLQDLIRKIANNEKIEESRDFATDIQSSLSQRLRRVSRGEKDRGVRKAPFVVLIGANMPSVLSEISFISNAADEQILKKPQNRQRVAEGLFRGVQEYLQSMNSVTFNELQRSSRTHGAALARSSNQR